MRNLKELMEKEKKRLAEQQAKKDLTPLVLQKKDFSLEEYKLEGIDTAYYIPQWITEDEESQIMAHARADGEFHNLTRRKLKVYGGIPVAYGEGMIPEEIPAWMNTLISSLNELRPFPGNHVLFNEYDGGQGIAHLDGPLYLDFVQILSLNGSATIEFFVKGEETPSIKVFLQPRSLFIFNSEAYTKFHHVIHSRKEDEVDETFVNRQLADISIGSLHQRDKQRLSFTVRTVPFIADKQKNSLTPEEEHELRRRKAVFYASVNEG